MIVIYFQAVFIEDAQGLKFKQCAYGWWDHSLGIGNQLNHFEKYNCNTDDFICLILIRRISLPGLGHQSLFWSPEGKNSL